MSINNCKKGKHNFIDIFTRYIGEDEYKVVRWCKDCGAIVIDLDVDGRTYAGYFLKCQIPKILKRKE